MSFDDDCAASLATVEKLGGVAQSDPLTWGAYSRDLSITFNAIDQKTSYALHCNALEGKIRVFARLNELCSELSQLKRDVEAEVSKDLATAGGEIVIEGLGEVKARHSAQSYSWDMPALVSVLIARAADEPDLIFDNEGELLPHVVFAQNVADRLAECVSFGYGRVGACEAHGVNAKSYRQASGERRRTLQMPKVER